MDHLIDYVNNGFVDEIDENDWVNALNHIGHLVVNKGYTEEPYIGELIRREEKYPTGLQLQDFAVALPHCDYKVKQEAVVILRSKNGSLFRRMDCPEEIIPVDLIFLMLINGTDEQVIMLSEIAKLLQNPELKRLLKVPMKDFYQVLKGILEQ